MKKILIFLLLPLLSACDPLVYSSIVNNCTNDIYTVVSFNKTVLSSPDDYAIENLFGFEGTSRIERVDYDSINHIGMYKIPASDTIFLSCHIGLKPEFDFHNIVITNGSDSIHYVSMKDFLKEFKKVNSAYYSYSISDQDFK